MTPVTVMASAPATIADDGYGHGRKRKISVPGVGTFGASYARDAKARAGRVYLVSNTPGIPPLSSELLCASLGGNPVLLCVSTECDACAVAMRQSGGTMVSADRGDALFISQMMRVPLIMLDSLSEESGEAVIVEIR